MVCLYLVNEHPFYMRMTANSIFMLRQHNKTIPIRLYYVEDGAKETAAGAFPTVYSSDNLFELCRGFNVEVVRRPLRVFSGEEGYFYIQKCQWGDVPEQEALCIDSDTFIFDDVAKLFDKYKNDMSASANQWVYSYGFTNELPFTPFNSGVVLWRNGWLQKWCAALPELSRGIREGTINPALTKWLYKFHPECGPREEFTIALLLGQDPFTTSYLDSKDVLIPGNDIDLLKMKDSIIAHTYSQHWRKALSLLKRNDRRF
jgi:hypothetical protein